MNDEDIVQITLTTEELDEFPEDYDTPLEKSTTGFKGDKNSPSKSLLKTTSNAYTSDTCGVTNFNDASSILTYDSISSLSDFEDNWSTGSEWSQCKDSVDLGYDRIFSEGYLPNKDKPVQKLLDNDSLFIEDLTELDCDASKYVKFISKRIVTPFPSSDTKWSKVRKRTVVRQQYCQYAHSVLCKLCFKRRIARHKYSPTAKYLPTPECKLTLLPIPCSKAQRPLHYYINTCIVPDPLAWMRIEVQIPPLTLKSFELFQRCQACGACTCSQRLIEDIQRQEPALLVPYLCDIVPPKYSLEELSKPIPVADPFSKDPLGLGSIKDEQDCTTIPLLRLETG
jgi:hypothetical protein